MTDDATAEEEFDVTGPHPRDEELAVRKYPQVGDISARSALTIHRGTPNTTTWR